MIAFIIGFFTLCVILLIILIIVIVKKYYKVKSDAGKVLLAIKRLRYGDINVRVEKLNNKELETTANRLFETMYDREMMIKEYQAALSDQNLSLEEIIKQEKQLQQFKEEFAATLTHDMKVPVIAELNSLNYLLEGRFGNLNEKQTEILKLMKASNQELKDLIENILETYKLEQKELKLNVTDNNIGEFIKMIIKEMLPITTLTSNNIVINSNIAPNTTCAFDTMQMKRVFKNLIQNAVSHSPNSSDIIIKLEKNGNSLNFYFTNKGGNITKQDLELIFQKYYSRHSKFKKAGTGLGLYLSQQIMLAHNGKIQVNCEEEGLTTFILTLPC